jgi:hypothetical protein
MIAKPETITSSDAKRRPCKSAMEMPPESRGIAPPSFGGAGLPMSSVACWCDGSVSERRLGNRLAVDSGQRDLDFSGARQGGRLLYGTSAAVACLERPTWLPSEAGIDTASQALGSANLNTTFSIYVHIGRQRPGVGSGRARGRDSRCAPRGPEVRRSGLARLTPDDEGDAVGAQSDVGGRSGQQPPMPNQPLSLDR